jgi:dTMP kinase
LSLPINIVQQLLKKRDSSKMKREYLKKKKDVHEADLDFMKNSIKSALWLAKREKNWIKIDCEKDGSIRTREEIHQEIYKKINKILK